MKKKHIYLLCFLLLFVFLPTNVHANDDLGIFSFTPDMSFKCGKPLITDEVKEEIEDFKNEKANMAQKFVVDQAQSVYNAFGINSLETLIFGNPYCVWGTTLTEQAEMSPDGIFTMEEREKVITPLLKLFGSLFTLMMVLAFLISGLKMMTNSIRGQAMSDFWQDSKMWLFALFLAMFYNSFTNIFFQINAAAVLSIKDLLPEDKMKGLSVLGDIGLYQDNITSFLVIMMGEWILALILNTIYLARKVLLGLLLVLGFIAIYSLLFAKTRAFFGNWLREFVLNTFLQSIHAIVFFLIIQFSDSGAGAFFKLGMLMMFIPITGLISRWLQFSDGSTRLGKAITFMGLGGIASTLALTVQAGNIIRGGSFHSSMGQSFSNMSSNMGGNVLSDLSNSIANDSFTTSVSAKAAGNNSSSFNMFKSAAGKYGAFTTGAAGAVLGPLGVALGAKAGKAVGEGLVQTGRNVTTGFSNLSSLWTEAKNYTNQNGSGFKALFGKNANFETLQARREFTGELGETLGLMLAGQKGAQIGRKMGHGFSAVSRQRLAETQSQEFGFGKSPISLSGLAHQYPNADMKFIQTNRGSGLFLNTGSGWKQVGLTGAADSRLRDGESRVIDYQLSNPAFKYEYQPNGTYKSTAPTLSESSISSSSIENTGVHTVDSKGMKVVGLQGSTPSLMRKSDAYIVNSGNVSNGNVSSQLAQHITSSSSPRHQDMNFNASKVNPDAFVYHNVPGVNARTGSDKAATVLHQSSTIHSWIRKANAQSQREFQKNRITR